VSTVSANFEERAKARSFGMADNRYGARAGPLVYGGRSTLRTNDQRERSAAWRSVLRTACVTLAILCSTPLFGDDEEATVGLRTHYVISDSHGKALGRATVVPRWTEGWNRTVIVFESEQGDRLLLEDRADYESRTTESRVSDWGGDDFIAMRMTLPFSGKTQKEAFAEAEATRMQIFKLMRDEIELETKSGSWKGSEAAWKGEARVALTRDLRRSISFELLETIERVADVALAIEPAPAARMILEYLLYRPVCGSGTIHSVEAVPDCAFDARLGYPCSEKQRERAKKAAEPDAEWLMY
jgi:hypothetical protein